MVDVPLVVGMLGDWKSGKEEIGWPGPEAFGCARCAREGGGDGMGRR